MAFDGTASWQLTALAFVMGARGIQQMRPCSYTRPRGRGGYDRGVSHDSVVTRSQFGGRRTPDNSCTLHVGTRVAMAPRMHSTARCTLGLLLGLSVSSTALAAEDPPAVQPEVGAAGVLSFDRMSGENELAGGGIARIGVRLSPVALGVELDVERGSNWGLTTMRLGARATAAWVYGPLRLGGGFGIAHRDVAFVDIDYIDSVQIVVPSPMLEASLDFVRTRYVAGFVAARFRLDVGTGEVVGGELIPAGQALLGVRFTP